MRIKYDQEGLLFLTSSMSRVLYDPPPSDHDIRNDLKKWILRIPEFWEGGASSTFQELALQFVMSDYFSTTSVEVREELLLMPLRKIAQSITVSEELVRNEFARLGKIF